MDEFLVAELLNKTKQVIDRVYVRIVDDDRPTFVFDGERDKNNNAIVIKEGGSVELKINGKSDVSNCKFRTRKITDDELKKIPGHESLRIAQVVEEDKGTESNGGALKVNEKLEFVEGTDTKVTIKTFSNEEASKDSMLVAEIINDEEKDPDVFAHVYIKIDDSDDRPTFKEKQYHVAEGGEAKIEIHVKNANAKVGKGSEYTVKTMSVTQDEINQLKLDSKMSDEFKQEYYKYLKSLGEELANLDAEIQRLNRENQACHLQTLRKGKPKAVGCCGERNNSKSKPGITYILGKIGCGD